MLPFDSEINVQSSHEDEDSGAVFMHDEDNVESVKPDKPLFMDTLKKIQDFLHSMQEKQKILIRERQELDDQRKNLMNQQEKLNVEIKSLEKKLDIQEKLNAAYKKKTIKVQKEIDGILGKGKS